MYLFSYDVGTTSIWFDTSQRLGILLAPIQDTT